MGTRSHIGFRKGNEVRYIYVAHDGYEHGKTLKAIGREECEKIWTTIGEADARGQRVWLDHLLTDEAFHEATNKGIQTTPRYPMLAEEPHWSKLYMDLHGDTLSGVIKIESSRRISPLDMIEMYNNEGTAWMYDFDTDRVVFSGNPVWTKPGDIDFGSETKEEYHRERVVVVF
jgi:hypothetical protein